MIRVSLSGHPHGNQGLSDALQKVVHKFAYSYLCLDPILLVCCEIKKTVHAFSDHTDNLTAALQITSCMWSSLDLQPDKVFNTKECCYCHCLATVAESVMMRRLAYLVGPMEHTGN